MADFTRKNDIFFARIISMIPHDLYWPQEEESEELSNIRYLKHKRLPLMKDEKKVISRKKRMDIYSTEDAGTKEETEEVEQEAITTDQGIESATVANESNDNEPCDGNSLENLRKKLQQRIQNMKSSRVSAKPNKDLKGKDARHKEEEGLSTSKNRVAQRKLKSTSNASDTAGIEGATEVSATVVKKAGEGKSQTVVHSELREELVAAVSKPRKKDVEQPAPSNELLSADIQFNTVKELVGDAAKGGDDTALGKPGSKMRRLKRMLAEAEKKRLRVQELKASGAEGQARVKEELWGEALKAAAGDKAALDPSKLKKAIKRREKDKQKSALQWKDRLDKVEESKSARLDKRESNILKRKHGGELPASAEQHKSVVADEVGDKASGVAKRPRLFHVLKDREEERRTGKGLIVPGGKAGEGAKGGSAKRGGAGRAGFEGKKQGFLNAPRHSK